MNQQPNRKGFYRLADNVYHNLPAFSDIFDEETFYVFAGCFTICTIAVAVLLSRFITIRPAYD